jgi:hypothetical protein
MNGMTVEGRRMMRFRIVLVMAAALMACENPFGPMASLDFVVTVNADGFVPGDTVPVTIVIRNPSLRSIEITDLRLGIDVILPNGEVLERPVRDAPLFHTLFRRSRLDISMIIDMFPPCIPNRPLRKAPTASERWPIPLGSGSWILWPTGNAASAS